VWLLRGLIECGHYHLGCNCHRMRGRNGTWHRYYYCRGHDPLRARSGMDRCRSATSAPTSSTNMYSRKSAKRYSTHGN
jgi:hypothetical protein